MGESSLSLSQKLALLPASIPDCVLDFLEDLKNPKPFEDKVSLASIKPEYWNKNKDEILAAVNEWRSLGEIDTVDGEVLPRQYPGGCICHIRFASREERGVGFIVSQGTGRTGMISVAYFPKEKVDSNAIKEKLIKHYRSPTAG